MFSKTSIQILLVNIKFNIGNVTTSVMLNHLNTNQCHFCCLNHQRYNYYLYNFIPKYYFH